MAFAEEKSSISNYTSQSSSSSSNNTKVDFATNIEFIKGNLSAAISNKQAGNNELTQTHTFHPITEIDTLIRDRLSSGDSELNKTLIDSLKNLTSIVIKSTSAELADSAASVESLLNKAIIIVLQENEIADIKYNMSTLINLLKTAESEYYIGIANGTITNISEYQNPHGFVSSANELLNETTNSLNQTLANNLSKIKDSLQELH
ncbi:MAG: hypothetical protein ACXW07_10975 [Nitrososphaeraceae archaeon]